MQKEKDNVGSIRPLIQEIENLYSRLNDDFFEGELLRPVFTFSQNAAGNETIHITRRKTWVSTRAFRDNREAYYEFRIRSDLLNSVNDKIVAMFLHAMVHLYNQMHDIEDTSRGRTYHNTLFRDAAEKHGLQVMRTDRHGWSETSLRPDLIEYARTLPISFSLFRPSAAVASRQRVRKYMCPVCRCSVRATKEVHITCTDCKVEYRQVFRRKESDNEANPEINSDIVSFCFDGDGMRCTDTGAKG